MKRPFDFLRSTSIRFQLTSLMDLLLIIVFAQYMDFKRIDNLTQIRSQEKIAETREEIENEYLKIASELAQTRQRLINENEQLRTSQMQAVVIAEEANRRHALLETWLRERFQIDPNVMQTELSPPESSDTLREAVATAASLQSIDSTELLRFYAGYDELLKRAEIWTLHISDRGDIELDAGNRPEQSQSFRLEARSQNERAEEFIRQLRAAYLQLPQPKGLVVILVSYSPRAIAGNFQPVLDGMPKAIEWLADDSSERTRFEYAVIGAITDPNRDLMVTPLHDPTENDSTKPLAGEPEDAK
ncbi:hypothetical protein Q31b_27490 [Novipirellula aureliae]|uniref:Uncharacterized protein n=1 Tax=Novipirellula aureliae TaxID=2527966 RepID=A0A5C6DX43_9BACT|nr:hypothetical protein [Novipirellula aureliae]TWU41310.1 hypothetical protein Q31b_27490 [Novipirellula aureliae]